MTDIKLNYVKRGTGKVLIFLHGNGENLTCFKKQIEFFSKNYCVYAIDTRGHGKSPWGDRPFTITQFAQDLYDFMVCNNINKGSIVGFSDGANIAMVFALKYPEKIDKLVLNGGNLYFKGLKFSVRLPIKIEYVMSRINSARSEKSRKHMAMLNLMINDPDIMPQQLKAIKAKTLVLAGTRDMIKYKHTELIYKMLPNAYLRIIPGTHFIAYENPDEFNAVVSEFLEEKLFN